MLIGEPSRTQADLNFSLLGIPIRVHPFFWLIGLLLGARGSDVRALLLWLVAFFVGILVHEFGHAWTMRAYGFRPWIVLYGLGGMAAYERRPGSGARGSAPLSQILISAAGPGAGFLLAAVVVGAILLSGHSIHYRVGLPLGFNVWTFDVIFSPYVTHFVNALLFVTVVYGILNLLPIYPLDGGRIIREVALWINPREGIRQSLILSMVVAAAVAVLAVKTQDWFIVMLFGYLAYNSYAAMRAYIDHRPW